MSTGIEWVVNPDGGRGETWNPTVGCGYASPGCLNCYAARDAAGRLSHLPAYEGLAIRKPGQPAEFVGRVRELPERLDQPIRWTKARGVFVNSMSDLFHPTATVEYIAQVFAVMAITRRHHYYVLTKRPQRMALVLNDQTFAERVQTAMEGFLADDSSVRLPAVDARQIRRRLGAWAPLAPWPLPNVLLGTSIESDDYLYRAGHLRDAPAAARFLSLEPLLSPLETLNLEGADWVDWVIVGGESGPGARPMHPDWPRGIRDKCAKAGIPFFFKQWGAWKPYAVLDNPTHRVAYDGTWYPNTAGCLMSNEELIAKVGPKAAGHTLEGRVHTAHSALVAARLQAWQAEGRHL